MEGDYITSPIKMCMRVLSIMGFVRARESISGMMAHFMTVIC